MLETKSKKKKHILIVSQYFYPEQFRINDIARELIKKGYKISVLTGIPNYPEGKFYKGYGWKKRRNEVWSDINIIRVPIFSRGNNKIRLVLNYYSFIFSGKIWAIFTRLKFNFVFTFGTSPLIQGEVGIKIANRLNIPHYLYVQDLWPDNLKAVANINNKFVLNHYYNVCKKIYNNSKTIFVTSKSFLKTLKNRTSTNLKYLPQYAEEFYKPVYYRKLEDIPNNGAFKIIFTGNIGKAQGLNVLVDAAKQIDNVTFIIIGSGRCKKDFIENLKDVKEKFVVLDRKPAEEIPYYLKACDVAFLSFVDNEIFNKTIPAKLQSYMACGMPILASASGECERIIKEAKCGYCSKPGNSLELVNNINRIKNSDLKILRINSLNYSRRNFNKNKIIGILCNEFDRYN